MSKADARKSATPTPAAKISLSVRVTTDLRRDIVSGRYRPGERLTEARLSADYGVSRVPVREALRTMESEGFVIVTSYTERVVASLNEDDRRDIYALRIAVESRAAARAAERLDAEGQKGLVDILTAGMAALSVDDFDGFSEINGKLHGAIAAASGSAVLNSMFAQLAAMVSWSDSGVAGRHASTSWMEHAEIVGAIVAKDPEKARARMIDHLSSVEEHARTGPDDRAAAATEAAAASAEEVVRNVIDGATPQGGPGE
jgi:DNA-binding GntR family transcriptional regulator